LGRVLETDFIIVFGSPLLNSKLWEIEDISDEELAAWKAKAGKGRVT